MLLGKLGHAFDVVGIKVFQWVGFHGANFVISRPKVQEPEDEFPYMVDKWINIQISILDYVIS
jgi:hypothetical protein